jgi:hypothetical protein
LSLSVPAVGGSDQDRSGNLTACTVGGTFEALSTG